MQRILLLTSIGLLFLYLSVSAQTVNSDSLSLVTKINADQLKLEKLQSQLEQKAKDKQDALASAQQSANKNSNTADKLSDKPHNKKLARKANKQAGNAKSDARKARKASERLDESQKDIQHVKNRIANNQGKLNKYIQDGRTNH